jgi:predicted ATP-grasp superfamily ATP-dependent carboligase
MKYLVSGFNSRAAAESGVKSGYEIVSLDCFGDVDHGTCCRLEEYADNSDLPYQERLFKQMSRLLRQEHFDGIICESGFENRPDLVKRLYKFGIPVLGNQPDVISRLRNFPQLSRKLTGAGFQAPLTFGGSEADLLKEKNTAGQRRWLKKPVRSGGGWGIDFVHDGARIDSDFVLQEYIEGLSCSFAFLAGGSGSMLLGVAEQLIGTAKENRRPFGYRGNIFPLILPSRADLERLRHAAADIARWLTATYGLTGLHGVDFIYDGENAGLWR